MALVVNTNVPSMTSQRYLMESRREMETSMERLSSGKRINSAADDAAGSAIAGRMDTQIKGLSMAIRNANDGISLTQTAEGAMDEVTDMLQRMRELSLQSVHGVNNDSDRAALDAEVQALKAEIDRIAETTTFNNQKILNGTYDNLFQIGKDAGDTLKISIGNVGTSALGLAAGVGTVADPTNTLISGRVTELTGVSFSTGDIVINGAAVDGLATADDISDLASKITSSVDNVTATGFNTVVAKSAGDGVVTAGQVAIKINSIGAVGDADYQVSREVQIDASASMSELVANINKAFIDGEVTASVNGDGKLVLSNNTGSTISIADESGTDAAYDGGTGFLVDTDAVTATVSYAASTVSTGFLKLTSSDETSISIDIGNTQLSSPGAVTDLNNLGFQRIIEDPAGSPYQLIGAELTTDGFTAGATIGRSSTTLQADVTINGVEIYDATLSANSTTFQGKLDLINAFSDETDVVASAYYEKSFDMSNMRFVATRNVAVNGTNVAYGADLATFATNLNAATATTGLTATVSGTNLILSGEGVQNVTLTDQDFALSDTVQVRDARPSEDTGEMSVFLSIGTADVTAGRTFKLDISSTTDGVIHTTATAASYTYTVLANESAADVASAFRDLIHTNIIANGTVDTADYGNLVSASAAQLAFFTPAHVGSATITLSVVQVTADFQAFSGDVAGIASIRLSASNNAPISIELGEASTEKHHGLKEMNVGDSTWDTNAATNVVGTTTANTVAGMSVASSAAAQSAITALDAALQQISDARSSLGATENRLTHTVDNLSNVVENTAASQSRILDADFAVEAAQLARAQVLQQAGTAMLAQANAAPQNVLSLLG